MNCRLCQSPGLQEIADLGAVPSIHILTTEAVQMPTFPLQVWQCKNCGLVQLPPLANTASYYETSSVYTTSHLPGQHLDDLLAALRTFRTANSVLEIGCNDGALLTRLQNAGFGPLMGIEPNEVARSHARSRGMEVLEGFFPAALDTTDDQRRFDVIIARHVLEHVEDIRSFLAAVHQRLHNDGVFLLEVPYPEPGFESGAPNVIWEEHINYFSESLTVHMLANTGFHVEMRRFYTGGALVFAVLATKIPPPAIPTWQPASHDLGRVSAWARKVTSYCTALHDTLIGARDSGWSIYCYGAGFRTSTTINTAKIGPLLDAVVDDRPDLVNYFMPGTICRIRPLASTPSPEKCLLLMGVGAEHEYKILDKIRTAWPQAKVVPLSLVYPGDVTLMLESAQRQMTEA